MNKTLQKKCELVLWFYANPTNWNGKECMIGTKAAKELLDEIKKEKSEKKAAKAA